MCIFLFLFFFFFQAEDGIRDTSVTGVQTCALPIWNSSFGPPLAPPATRDVFVWAACSQTSLLINCAPLPIFIVGAQGTSMAAPHVKIGRASCRERVENLVVDGCIKKIRKVNGDVTG